MNLNSPAPTESTGLRSRIAPVCHAIRALVVVHLLFGLIGIFHSYFLRKPEELGSIAVTGIDFSGASDSEWNLVLALSLALWLTIAAVSYCLYQVFTIYLDDGVFSLSGATWLRRAGISALVVVFCDFLWRSAIVQILAWDLPEVRHSLRIFVSTEDILHLIVALIFLALGHVQKAAAEIADEHSQFV